MSTDQTGGEAGGAVAAGPPEAEPPAPRKRRRALLQAGRRTPLPRQFAWRLILLRFLVNAVALALVVIVVPDIYFQGTYRIISWLAISAVFGLLNAFVKPIVQVLTLPLWVYSYGVVIILINAVMLAILDIVIPARFEVGNLLSAFIGGLVFGLAASVLENLLGLTPPIFEGEPEDLRKAIEERAHAGMETRIVAAGATLSHRHAAPVPAPPAGVALEEGEPGAGPPGPVQTAPEEAGEDVTLIEAPAVQDQPDAASTDAAAETPPDDQDQSARKAGDL